MNKLLFLYLCLFANFALAQTTSKIRAVELLSEKRVREEINDNSQTFKTVVETISEKDSLAAKAQSTLIEGQYYKSEVLRLSNLLKLKKIDYNSIVTYDTIIAAHIKTEIDETEILYKKVLAKGYANIDELKRLNSELLKANPKKIVYYYAIVILTDKGYNADYTTYSMHFTPDLKIYDFKKDD